MKTEDLDNLCKRLEENDRSLISLSLEYASLGSAGAKRIAEALRYNQYVSFISLKECGLGYEGMKCIFEALQKRTSRTRVVISDDCSESEEEALRRLLKIQKKEQKKIDNPAKTKYRKNPYESYRNGKGLDEKVSWFANNNLGHEYEHMNAVAGNTRTKAGS